MSKSPKNIPNNFPQPLGMEMLKAETHRQESLLRHEFAAALIELLTASPPPHLKSKLGQCARRHLKEGMRAAEKAEGLWPEEARAREHLAQASGGKPGAARFLKLFREYDGVQKKSLKLLHQSHRHIEIILEKLQGPDASGSAPGPEDRDPA